jgi:hypothetical protein
MHPSSGNFGMGTFEVYVRQAIALEEKYGSDFMTNQGGTVESVTHDRTGSSSASGKKKKHHNLKYKMATDLTDDKLDEIAEHLKETLKDGDAHIIFEPSKKGGREEASLVAIELFGVDHRTAIDEIIYLMVHQMEVDFKGK